ncbi:MAG: rod shape-determining protein RodA [Elusimicrobia bacterium]|jgi:rod shape determining protein RodA|nr:rod shape-determining protein RodA [Elusimicrobiota bacterium]
MADIVPHFFRVGNSSPSPRMLARVDWSLLAAVLALSVMGILFVFSATLQGGHASNYLWRQGLGLGVGLLAMVFLTLLPYQVFQTYAKGVYVVSVALLVLTLVVGTRLRGSRSWIDLGSVYFQPVEVTRLGLAIALAAYAVARSRNLRYWSGAIPLLLLSGVHFGLVLLQPDLSSSLTMGPMTLAVLFVAGVPVGFLATLLASGAIALGIPLVGTYFSIVGNRWSGSEVMMALSRAFQETGPLLLLWAGVALGVVFLWWFIRRWRVPLSGFSLAVVLLIIATGVAGSFVVDKAIKPYQRKRLMAFIDPAVDPLGAGYNILQSEIAVGSGRFVGKGFLSGSQTQLGFLPEKHTDFIFSLVAEETGFMGALFLLGVYFWVSWRAFDIASTARDYFGRYLATAVGAFFTFSGLVNIGMAMGLMPVTGVPLPFLSYGGSGIVGSFMAIGLLMSIHLRRYIL